MFKRLALLFIVIFLLILTACGQAEPKGKVNLDCGSESEKLSRIGKLGPK